MGGFSTFLFFLVVLQFPLHLLSADYTPPDRFFVNCGSDSNVTVGNRTFVGDETPGTSFSFSDGKNTAVTKTNSSLQNSLYQTARLFRRPSRYEFSIIDGPGIYFVRLHFFENTNLGGALFDVSTSNFSLLSKFSGRSGSGSSSFPVIEEFLIVINESKFAVEFTPSNRNSIAFVNAIEVFLAPNDTVADTLSAVYSSTGSNYSYTGVRSQVLHTVHRINVGGSQKTDNLWRNWVEDANYLISEASSRICAPYSGNLHYNDLGSTIYNAPEFVYDTCRELITSNGVESSFLNITWRLKATKNARHLVRAHFCDIISKQPGDIHFNLSISSTYSMLIDPYGVGVREHKGFQVKVATPFYYDLVVDSDDSGYMDVSVVPRRDSLTKTAYLNGLEMMEFVKRVDEHRKSKMFLFVIIGSAILLAFILAVVLVLGFKYRKAKQQQRYPPVTFVGGATPSPKTSLSSKTTNSMLFPSVNLNLKISFAEILVATNKFDSKLLIGEGGFGKVYRGTLKGGMTVAVKRSDPNHGQGRPEFETEVLVLSKIRHRNLVSLIGYCNDGSEMILVYEFMEKGTLRDHLYRNPAEKWSLMPKLAWKERLEICLGAARGIHYLHNGSAERLVHRDVKSTNILLDEHYVAKVSDFGLSQSVDQEPEQFTAGIKGSFGYIDPEYYKTFQFTSKSDVYSFGVVLLEVLCARPALVDTPMKEEMNLAEWGMHWKKKGQLEKIMDPVLIGNVRPDSMRKFSELVEKCLSDQGDERPTMEDVAWDLEYALQLQITNTNGMVQDDSWTNVASGFSSIGVFDIPSQSQGMTSKEVHNETESFAILPKAARQTVGVDDPRRSAV